MKFIRSVPDILVNDAFKVKTVQYFDEDEDRLVLRVAEYIPQFTRGYVCDMTFNFPLIDKDTYEDGSTYHSHTNDLVLVHIRKTVDIDSFPQIEYVFYKQTKNKCDVYQVADFKKLIK